MEKLHQLHPTYTMATPIFMAMYTKRITTSRFFKKLIFALPLLTVVLSPVFSQKRLSTSRQSSYYTYIYKLNADEVEWFYKHPGEQPSDKILNSPIDSFKTDKYWENTLTSGNYIKAKAEKNKINYQLIENHSAIIKILVNNYDLRFILLDKQGNNMEDAIVKVDSRPVFFDSKSKTYHTKGSKKNAIIRADCAGISNFFMVKPDDRDSYYHPPAKNWAASVWSFLKRPFSKSKNYYGYRFTRNYTGFMVFNKPIYKPHDTVKLKAFILEQKSKKPIDNQQLLVVLQQVYNGEKKTLGTVNPYKPGGFEYQFKLDDSLKLSLDRSYTITLEHPSNANYDPNGHSVDENRKNGQQNIFISGNFHYEDYELNSVHFTTRADKKTHAPGDPQVMYLKATDENDLLVPDGHATLTIVTKQANYYKEQHTFVPDTLWRHQLTLDAAGETKVVIPDSIFPKADVKYRIDADFLNASNEHQYSSENAAFEYKKYDIVTELSGDTLIAHYKKFGREIKAQALISALNNNDDEDTLTRVKVMLPSKTLINPVVKTYTVETDSASTDIDLKDFDAGLSLSGERNADSLLVKVNNSRNIHFWYSVFAGNKLIDAGEAEQLFYRRAYRKHDVLTFLVNYVWGGEAKVEQASFVYRNDQLKINVKQPLSVYPGQRVETEMVITDAAGNPVANTDATAWAVTRKFQNYQAPQLPYLGKPYAERKYKQPFQTDDFDATGNIKLNWSRWSHEMGLDSITYYQFTHAAHLYQIEEPGIDTITQIAPFIVKDGDIVPVHILYIDEKPVYFSQSGQLQRYSFRVAPGRHALRFRTSHQNIKLDSVLVERSKKLILGINADDYPSTKLSDTLSDYEAQLLNKYLITMIDNFGARMAQIKQNDRIFFLNPNPGVERAIVTGPLADNFTELDVQGEKPRFFRAEPGYSYLFEPGFLKQKSISSTYPFNPRLSSAPGAEDYTQYVLTTTQADSIWQDFLDHRNNSQQLFVNPPVTEKQTGKLIITRTGENKKEYHELIKNVIIYRYDDPDFIRIYPGNTTDFGNLAKGKYRLLFLLKGDKYDIRENIDIMPYGQNDYKMPVTATHQRDSVSIKISGIINSRSTLRAQNDYDIENDALKIKEAFNERYLAKEIFTNTMTGQVVDKNDNSALAGVSIRVKGTTTGTLTDRNGHFSIKVPAKGTLILTYIGYQTKAVKLETGKEVKIQLEGQSQSLNEVTVIGYGSVRKKDLTGAVSVTQLLQGRVAGLSVIEQGAPGAGTAIFIRGINSFGNKKPLYIVDGVPVDDLKGLSAGDIGEVNVLQSAAAVALYGSSAANGVVIIVTKKQNTNPTAIADKKADTIQTLRNNFNDYAYWQPKLTTDENGKASFITTMPDDITNWRTFVIGINGQRQSGFAEGQIKSFKPVSANFISPQFAVAGDQINVIGKILNYNTEPVNVNRTFTYNGKILKQDALTVKNSKIDTLPITAEGKDSLTFEYSIKRDNGYFDGERRKIPVLEQGTTETKGVFEALNNDTTLNLKFDPALGPVKFTAEASLLPALKEEAERLRNYKYLCNEQLASKLKGLLAEKRIDTYLKEPFKWDRNIRDIINKLQENRKSQGTWGWWKDTGEELWISLHAVEALLDAQQSGYQTQLDKDKLTQYLVYQLDSYKGVEKLACLQLLKELGAKADYVHDVDVIDKEMKRLNDTSKYDLFRLILLKQEAGIAVRGDSLLSSAKHTLFGNLYWGENGYRFFDNSIQLSALAYHILKNESKHPELLAKIRGYFLEQRHSDNWRNTYETSIILETILPDLLTSEKKVTAAQLKLSGAVNETVAKFPHTTTFTNGQLSVAKTGTLPVYITGYQQFWNRKPEKVSKDFVVSTHFEKKGELLNKLKGGEPVTLKVDVTAKGDADFVMIEIPIPAGCSYENKEQPYDGIEVHREYFKDRVSIFCRKLKQGAYTFNISLLPRFDGLYTLNPAKAEMMYFPVFYGREGMKKVAIGE